MIFRLAAKFKVLLRCRAMRKTREDWWVTDLAQYDGCAWHESTRRLHAFYFGVGHSGFTLKLGPYRISGYRA